MVWVVRNGTSDKLSAREAGALSRAVETMPEERMQFIQRLLAGDRVGVAAKAAGVDVTVAKRWYGDLVIEVAGFLGLLD